MVVGLTIHSYRCGVRRSTTTTNFAVLLELYGKKVATIGPDLTSPGPNVIYQVSWSQMKAALNDYIFDKIALEDVIVDPVNQLQQPRGKIYFLGASIKLDETTEFLEGGYSERFFKTVAKYLGEAYGADYAFFDTYPRLDEDTFLPILSLMRMNKRDKQALTLWCGFLRSLARRVTLY